MVNQTVYAPSDINDTQIFSTENVTSNRTDGNVAKIHIPRLAHDDGGLIVIDVHLKDPSTNSSLYKAYLAYDKGSWSLESSSGITISTENPYYGLTIALLFLLGGALSFSLPYSYRKSVRSFND